MLKAMSAEHALSTLHNTVAYASDAMPAQHQTGVQAPQRAVSLLSARTAARVYLQAAMLFKMEGRERRVVGARVREGTRGVTLALTDAEQKQAWAVQC